MPAALATSLSLFSTSVCSRTGSVSASRFFFMCAIVYHCYTLSRKIFDDSKKSCYTRTMALGTQLPIRLEPAVDARLQAAAEQAGTSKSALIRMLAKTFVDQCISPSGQVTLPPNWHQLLPERDGRSSSKGTGHRVSVKGDHNVAIGGDFKSASAAPAQKPLQRPKGKRGKKGSK